MSEFDVLVIGAGPGGLAASIFLMQTGLRVACVEPESFPHTRVGESLDWSSPALLKKLGISVEELVAEQDATYKLKVKVSPQNEEGWTSGPGEWMAKQPFGLEHTTLHVNRTALDQRLFETAQELGATFIWDRVKQVEKEGDRIIGCILSDGQRITAKWFIDGSGIARVLGKAFNIAKIEYGKPKVSFWAHFANDADEKATTIRGNPHDEYLSWVWEIPITPHEISVGSIMGADRVVERRRAGLKPHDIFFEELAQFPRFVDILREQPDVEVNSCSYRCYVSEYVCGPNWLIVGEAASMPDPLTSNGVTAAMRHAQDAANLIGEAFARESLSTRQRWVYNTNVCRMGNAYNYSIEKAVYDWPLRRGLGTRTSFSVYVYFGFVANALYSKFAPRSRLAMALFGAYLASVRLWMITWSMLGRTAFRTREIFQR